MTGMNIKEKNNAMKRPHHGSPDFAAYVVPSAIPVVPIKMATYHQFEISLYI